MEEDDSALTYTLERFQVEEVMAIINQLIQNSSDEILLESDNEKLTVILGQYQEQSHLMDPHLEEIITKLLTIVRDLSTPKKAFHQVFKYLYLFTKVRGYKHTIRMFSHEVADLEFVLKLLKDQSPNDHNTWETRYILLLWLAIICIIPFDLSRLDGTSDIQEDNMILNRILNTILLYLDVSDKSKDAAAYLAAKFLTRPDVKSVKLCKFIEHAISMLNTVDKITMSGMNATIGLLSTLVQIFKYGRREDLLPYAAKVFECVSTLGIMDIDNTFVRKLTAKLTQRVGLVFLVPKVASWRYMRGSRSLAQNLEKDVSNHDEKPPEVDKTESEGEEDFDIPEEVEHVLELLIVCLKDKDTVVRWTTAKGIGRITGRLPEELADEVVASLLELFRYSEVDGAWHGGCLALAELGRRGLLLPSRLYEVVPIILKALTYDERRGSYSVGSHVRDAACYVCWSFARAYEPCQIKPFVVDIATSLLITTVFDREVNCRRAASAAFQENVGRQGTFPHGIEIVTTADYFAVGNRYNCYCILSVFIAEFPEYTKSMIDHLRNVMIAHWDSCIRELISQAFYNLTAVAPDYMQETVLPYLLQQTSSIDICTKHGAILAVAEIIHALFTLSVSGKDDAFNLPVSIISGIKSLVAMLRAANKFKGYSGELMRVSVCKLIEKMSLSKIPIDDDNVLDDWLFVIEDTLPHTIETVQNSAIHSLSPFFMQYVQNSQHFNVNDIIQRYCSKLKSPLKFERMGFAMAIGELPIFMIRSHVSDILSSLIECCIVDDDKINAGVFAESRRNSVNSIMKVSLTLQTNFGILSVYLNDINMCFLKATEDYTLDSRGDVGAWVREAAMSGLSRLTYLVIEENPTLITPDICRKIMCCLVQQASEKIDRTRAHAGELLLGMIHHVPEIPFIPHKSEVMKILPSSLKNTLNWSAPTEGFKAIIKLLHLKEYQYPILLGITISAGGLTESLVRASSDCLLEFLSVYQERDEEMDMVTNNLLEIMRNYQKTDRVIIPMLKLLDMLLSAGSLELYNNIEKSSTFPLNAFLLIKGIIQKCGDVKKLLASINVFCGLVPFQGDIRKKALLQLMIFLCHKYPRIRKVTAEQLYTTLVTYDDIIAEEFVDDVTTNLVEAPWDDTVENIRPIRNQICNWLGIPPPKLRDNVLQRNSSRKLDDLDSYKDLVTRHGY